MSTTRGGLVEGARRRVGRRGRTPVTERLQALDAAAHAARGRLDGELVEAADEVVRRASGRLALSADHTVVALAGATGSGKSSLFNALAGADLATVGIRRPTTAVTTAVSVGPDEPVELLEWLAIPLRHRVEHPDHGVAHPELDGLVLLDLPDHDSTEVAHHLEVDRLVRLVDLMVWVLDPQKYADAAVHERYLRPLARHGEVMVVVLNHVDEVPGDQRGAVLDDLRRRLVEDGLDGVPLLVTSARTGEGISDLRAAVAQRVRDKRAVADRLAADVAVAASALAEQSGRADPGRLRKPDREELLDAFADAAGVPTVVRAVERSVARRGSQHTGWPFTAWLGRLRPDPLRRLHLDLDPTARELTAVGRASMPEPTRVQRARVDTAVRVAADAVGAQLSPPWARALRAASVSRLDEIDDALDRAVGSTELGVARVPVWWRLTRLVQGVLALAVLAGALWLGGLALLGALQLPAPDPPESSGLPLPTLLLLVGVAGGLALGLVTRVVNRAVARSRARSAQRRLRSAIGEVADALVIAPLDAELEAYAALRRSLDLALHR